MSNDENKPKLSKEQIAALMAQMAGKNPNSQPQMQPNQSRFKRYFNNFLTWLSKFVKHIDRFVDFIVKPNGADRNDVIQYSRAPILFGVYVIIIFFCFGFLWSATAPLYSAAGASGVLIADSHRQLIQNSRPGVVKAIYVKLGDKVKKGQKLLEIEEVQNKAKYEQHFIAYMNDLAAVARLTAEKDGLNKVIFPEELTSNKDNPEIEKLMENHIKLFHARTEAQKSKIAMLMQKKQQHLKELDTHQASIVKLKKHTDYSKSRLDAQQQLFDEGHTTRANLDKSEIEYEAAKNEYISNDNRIAQVKQSLMQNESEIKANQSANLSEILRELKETTSHLYSVKEELRVCKDNLEKEIILAPVDGTVNVINIHTIGGYLQTHSQYGPQGAAVMEITPDSEKLIIDARIPQTKIAHVTEGMEAVIKFSAFKSRTSPSFKGKVVALSTDAIEDPRAGQAMGSRGLGEDNSFYQAKIEIDMEDFNKLTKGKDMKLQAGMRADIMIITGKRTLLRYLLDPLTDSLFRAFKEK